MAFVTAERAAMLAIASRTRGGVVIPLVAQLCTFRSEPAAGLVLDKEGSLGRRTGVTCVTALSACDAKCPQTLSRVGPKGPILEIALV